MALVRHPSLWAIAQHLREVATLIEDNGHHDGHATPCHCVPCQAQLLSARGWPTTVISDGSRSSDTTSSTERAVVSPPMRAFAGIDERIAKHLRLLWLTGLNVQADVRNVLAHGSDEDRLPPGSGECPRCGHFCRPDLKYEDRLKSGYCSKCHRLWLIRGRPERSAFTREKVKSAA